MSRHALETPRRPILLVYRTLGLGDLLTAVPAIRGLRRGFDGHHLVLAAPAWLAPIVELIDAVDEHLPTPELAPVETPVDVAVNLHGRGPRSTEVLRATDPRRLISFGVGGVEWRPDEHERERWCRLVETAGTPCDPGDVSLPAPDDDEALPRVSVVHPGAKDPARRWPPERFAEVARQLPDPVVTGSADERTLASEVAQRARIPAERVLAGRTSLRELAAMVAHARVVVCGDTGVQHLATAFATPSVVLFGPVPPAEWGPPADRPRHVALWAGRRGDPHGHQVDPGLLEITVDDVLAGYERAQLASATTQ